jgi:hypothetical protein
LHLAVKGLVHDAVAAVLAANLWLLAVAIALVKFLSQELEELVSILFFGGYQILEGLLLRNPEPRQDVSGRVAVGVLESIEILEHIVHGAAQAVRNLAVVVAIAEVKVTEERVMEEALEDNVLVASGSSVIDAAKAVSATRGGCGIVGDVSRVILNGVLEELIMLPLAT